jgi:hypothetical protein
MHRIPSSDMIVFHIGYTRAIAECVHEYICIYLRSAVERIRVKINVIRYRKCVKTIRTISSVKVWNAWK